MTKITQETRQVATTVYHWRCPGCNRVQTSHSEPYEDALLCHECSEAKCNQEFQANFAPVIGATVESIEPYDAILYPDDLVKFILLRAPDGRLWKATTDDTIYLFPVEEDR